MEKTQQVTFPFTYGVLTLKFTVSAEDLEWALGPYPSDVFDAMFASVIEHGLSAITSPINILARMNPSEETIDARGVVSFKTQGVSVEIDLAVSVRTSAPKEIVIAQALYGIDLEPILKIGDDILLVALRHAVLSADPGFESPYGKSFELEGEKDNEDVLSVIEKHQRELGNPKRDASKLTTGQYL